VHRSTRHNGSLKRGGGESTRGLQNCIARLDTMEVSREERAKALGVFKSAVNRELFICADVETALIWLQGEWHRKGKIFLPLLVWLWLQQLPACFDSSVLACACFIFLCLPVVCLVRYSGSSIGIW
jgi:hypothetical protein